MVTLVTPTLYLARDVRMNMELSPLARERLAKIGSLSPEEKERIKQSGELDSMLSEYFRGTLSSEDLWKRLKALKEQSGKLVIKEAQTKLVDTLRLQMSQGWISTSVTALF